MGTMSWCMCGGQRKPADSVFSFSLQLGSQPWPRVAKFTQFSHLVRPRFIFFLIDSFISVFPLFKYTHHHQFPQIAAMDSQHTVHMMFHVDRDVLLLCPLFCVCLEALCLVSKCLGLSQRPFCCEFSKSILFWVEKTLSIWPKLV